MVLSARTVGVHGNGSHSDAVAGSHRSPEGMDAEIGNESVPKIIINDTVNLFF